MGKLKQRYIRMMLNILGQIAAKILDVLKSLSHFKLSIMYNCEMVICSNGLLQNESNFERNAVLIQKTLAMKLLDISGRHVYLKLLLRFQEMYYTHGF